jgi:putative two-component system response regulator
MEMHADTRKRATILIVDDAPENIAVMSSLLRATYRTKIATDGEKALHIVNSPDPVDLILLDITMPGIDGYEVCRRLKADPQSKDIPVIFLTARTDTNDEERGFELGAVDFITKPFSPSVVTARVKTQLQLKNARDYLLDKSEYLEREVVRRTQEVNTIQDVTMIAMGSLAETRDNETGNHIRRTQFYVKALAERLSGHPRFSAFLTPEAVQLLHKSAPLHDIGKVGIPDSILLKPGKLTPEEFTIMKTHTIIGRNAIIAAEAKLDAPTSFLRYARDTAWSHHEKWDGTGYPEGVSGDDILICGRIMAVADVYDALISKRIYKAAFPHEKALTIITEGSGTHFDPDVVEAFTADAGVFQDIAQAYGDQEGAVP